MRRRQTQYRAKLHRPKGFGYHGNAGGARGADQIPLLAILERADASQNIDEGCRLAIWSIFRGRLPGKLLAGVGKPRCGVTADLDPSDQRVTVQRLRDQHPGDRGLADDGPKFGGDDAAVAQDTGLGVASEMKDGPHLGPPRWTGKLVPFSG